MGAPETPRSDKSGVARDHRRLGAVVAPSPKEIAAHRPGLPDQTAAGTENLRQTTQTTATKQPRQTPADLNQN